MEKKRIRVGHSPDPDDAFMFYALTFGRIDSGPYEFVHQLEDIETLNRRALVGELEVSAVSIHAYAQLTDKYALLPTGSSMGDQYGPMIVAREPFKREELPSKSLAVPGTLTTAFLAASLYSQGKLQYTVVPFDEILNRVEKGEFDAGLIIHEGQLTFAQQGLSLHVDLGVWWQNETGLPCRWVETSFAKISAPRRWPTSVGSSAKAFSTPSTIKTRHLITLSSMLATWNEISPASSSRCTSITGRSITASAAGPPSACFLTAASKRES